MKIRSRSVYDPARPAQDEGRFTLEHRARIKVWLGHRSEPQIVASLRREHAGQIGLPFDVLRRRERGADHGERFSLLRWFGHSPEVGRSLCATAGADGAAASSNAPLGNDDPGPPGDG